MNLNKDKFGSKIEYGNEKTKSKTKKNGMVFVYFLEIKKAKKETQNLKKKNVKKIRAL